MEIIHDTENRTVKTVVNGRVAYVTYVIENGELDVRHTMVPSEIWGRGIAAALVKYIYDYAAEHDLRPVATCSYAVVWLRRHPEYNGKIGRDYAGAGSCPVN